MESNNQSLHQIQGGSAPTGSALTVGWQVRLLGGEAGRALAAAQGRALSALLASLAETEVGQDEEVLP